MGRTYSMTKTYQTTRTQTTETHKITETRQITETHQTIGSVRETPTFSVRRLLEYWTALHLSVIDCNSPQNDAYILRDCRLLFLRWSRRLRVEHPCHAIAGHCVLGFVYILSFVTIQ
jgi:hypothetical protein